MKRSDIITGRGFAKPPAPQQNIHQNSYNIYQAEPVDTYSYQNNYNSYNNYNSDHYVSEDYHQSDSYYDNSYGYANSEPQQSSYLPSSDYDKLKENLSLNDQLRSYINSLKQKLEYYTSPKDAYNYERKTAIDLNQYQNGIPESSRYLFNINWT